MNDIEGVLVGAPLGYLVGTVIALTQRVRKLEQALQAQGLRDATIPVMPSATVEERQVPPPLPVDRHPEPGMTSPPMAAEIPSSPLIPPPAPAAMPEFPQREDEAPLDRLIARLKGFFTDGNVMVKVGLFVLFIGIGFLLKLAAEHQVFPVELRVASVGVGGLVLLGIGWRLRDRRRGYGLSLQGGGIGIMYLTGFAAARLYTMIPVSFAFFFMLALVIFSALLAVLQDAKYLAFYGAAGGFLAPILASTGTGSHVALFSYYALLNLGIVGIAWYRAWRELNVLGFLCTFIVGAMWGGQYYRPEFLSSVEPFLLLFFALFVLIAVLFAWRQPPNLKGYVDGTLVFGVPIAGFALQAALVRGMPYGLAFSALGLSSFYILLASVLWQRRLQGMGLLTEAFLALGVVFGSLAIPLALEGRWTTVAWALEGAALVWVGVRQQRLLARAFGLFLQLASGTMFVGLHVLDPALSAPHGTPLGGAMISAAGLFSGYILYTYRQAIHPRERWLHVPLLLWGLLWWFGTGEWEIAQRLTDHRTMLVVSVLFVSGSFLLLHLLDSLVDWPVLAYPVLGHLYAMLFFLGLAVLAGFRHPSAHWGWLAWLVALTVQYGLLYRWRPHISTRVQQWQHLLTFWVLLVLLTWDGTWLAQEIIAGSVAWRDMAIALIPAGMVLLLLTIGRSLPWPVAAHPVWYTEQAVLPVLVLLWLYALGMGLVHPGNPWPLQSYLPILNPIDLVVLFLVFLAVFWNHHLRQQHSTLLTLLPSRLQAYAIALLAFAWFNGMIARAIHHWLEVPYTLYALGHRVEFQTTIAVLWTLVALSTTFFATRKQQRELWFVGAGLLAMVIVKLFLIDLKHSNTVARIVSFIVVGALMLVIGYVAPIPPRHGEERS